MSPLYRNRVIGLAVALFCCAIIPDFRLHFLSLFGWIVLFLILLKSKSVFQLLASTGIVNLLMALIGFFWILLINESLFLPAVGITFWFLPAYLLLLWLINTVLKPQRLLQPAIWSVVWLAYGWFFSKTAANDMPLLGFFSFPLPALQVVKHMPYLCLTGLWIYCSASFALFADDSKLRANRINAGLAVLFCFFIMVFGFFVLGTTDKVNSSSSHIRVAIIQHNLNYDNTRKHAFLTRFEQMADSAAKLNQIDLVVFPLYTVSVADQEELLSDHGVFHGLAQRLNIPILIATRLRGNFFDKNLSADSFFVSALLFEPDGHRKIYRSVARSALHDPHQHLASQYEVLSSSLGDIGVLLCYECARTQWAQAAHQQGADFLVGLSNPADAPYSSLPYYTLRLSQMRAIETGLSFVLSSPNGFSGWIDAFGRVRARSQLRQHQILNFNVSLREAT